MSATTDTLSDADAADAATQAADGLRLVAGTEPYPWPWDGALDGCRLALIIAGADQGWVERCDDAEAVALLIEELAIATRAVRGQVIHLHHGPSPTPAATPEVDPADLVVPAAGIDGFYGSALDPLLRARGRDQLVMVGFGLEAAVHSTMRSANDQGYECLLVTDACAPLVAALAAPAVSMVTMSGGIFGAIGTAAPTLAALAALPHPDLTTPIIPEALP